MARLLDVLQEALADRYEVEREIGSGGMAVVFLAHDRRHRRPVALKTLRPDLGVSIAAERFLREIEIVAQFTHPHILPLYDSGQADGVLYYVSPFVEGGSVRDQLTREGRLPLPQALRIAAEVADALAYAHERGVVHRDVKPENILLASGHALVADFGIARALRRAALAPDVTQPGFVVGTLAYMSPEQAGGDPTDGRSDIFSLGCVLYEMLAGDPPFGPTGLRAVAEGGEPVERPVRLRVRRPSIPAAVERIVETAIAERPADRFATAADLAERLAAVRGADGPESGAGVWRLLRGRRAMLGVALALAVVVGLAYRRYAELAPAAASSVVVVVLPFDAAPGLGDARATLAVSDLFREAVEALPELHGVDGGGGESAVLEPGTDRHRVPPAELREAARRLGGRYLVVGGIAGPPDAPELTVDVYAVDDERRVIRSTAPVRAAGLNGAIGRVALETIRAVASREGGRLLGASRRELLSSTTSAFALRHLVEGQHRLHDGDRDGAIDEFRNAIAADSNCALAYHRLSVAHIWWMHDYPAALADVDAGLVRRARLPRDWVALLEAQRAYVLRDGNAAIAGFQRSVHDRPGNADGWLGLAEALFHYAWFSGHRAADAQRAFETLVQLDSAFAPIDEHVADLAIYRGDVAEARRAVRRMRADDAARPAREAVIALRFGTPEAQEEAWGTLPTATRTTLSEMVAMLTFGGFDVALADSVAGALLGPGRTPDDRLRGAEYRLVTRAALGRWPEGLEGWLRAAPDTVLDEWLAQAYFAGLPVGDHVAPMFRRARALVAAGRAPDFARDPWDERQDAFLLLVHRALREGDSTEVRALLRALDGAAASAAPSDPVPPAARASLEARLALLAGDTARVVRLLAAALGRIDEPYATFNPLRAMAPQRALLAELLMTRGQDAESGRRWADSFSNTRSIADLLYADRVRRAGARAAAPSSAR